MNLLRKSDRKGPRREPQLRNAPSEAESAPETAPGAPEAKSARGKRPSGRLGQAVRPAGAPSPTTRRLSGRPERRPARRLSPLTIRILAVNVLALMILGGGMMYLGEYRDSLVAAKVKSLTAQGRIVAGSIGESGVKPAKSGGLWLDPDSTKVLLRRLVPRDVRARVFSAGGVMVVDSRMLLGRGGSINVEDLPPPRRGSRVGNAIVDAYDWFVALFDIVPRYPAYVEAPVQKAGDYTEVMRARKGEASSAVRATKRGRLLISVAIPIQHYKRVIGVLMLSSADGTVEASLRDLRLDILKVFAVVLAITVLMSLYLAHTIARPIRRLAIAADAMRQGKETEIPDLTKRRDEIGDLSGSLRELTAALNRRMSAIERFAADVSHEIKNPLSSMRSAIETVERVDDPERKLKLLRIVLDDVERLDRLISDIAAASRLDAQLSRRDWKPIDLGRALAALVELHEATQDSRALHLAKKVTLLSDEPGVLMTHGNEGQLVQVFRNLINNAVSFTPKGTTVTLTARWAATDIEVIVDDQGPGVPEDNLESIFRRFYSERPTDEPFGQHSGLGLSISKQIVEAHGGMIWAENRRGASGQVLGARFIVRLPRTDI